MRLGTSSSSFSNFLVLKTELSPMVDVPLTLNRQVKNEGINIFIKLKNNVRK